MTHSPEDSAEAIRRTLASAVVLRDLSLRVQKSNPRRQAFRASMRDQAIRWRHMPGALNRSS